METMVASMFWRKRYLWEECGFLEKDLLGLQWFLTTTGRPLCLKGSCFFSIWRHTVKLT